MADADTVVLVILECPSLLQVLLNVQRVLFKGASQCHALRNFLSEICPSQPDTFRQQSLISKELVDVL
jgi:hypothetical protein